MHTEIKKALIRIAAPIQDELQDFEGQFQERLSSDPHVQRIFEKSPDLLKGKRLRPILFLLCKRLVGGQQVDAGSVAILLEMLHLASLIHDDVVDGAFERRGMESLNAIWGNHISVLAGDYIIGDVMTSALESDWPDVYLRITEIIKMMTQGELKQAMDKDNPELSVEHYLQVIREKTASLFSIAAQLGGIVAEAGVEKQQDLREFGVCFGLAFQIHDDILDYCGDGQIMGKAVGQDYQEGLLTLPAILALENTSETNRAKMSNIFRAHREENWPEFQNFVIESRGVEEAFLRARTFTEKGLVRLEKFEESSSRDALADLIAFDMERSG